LDRKLNLSSVAAAFFSALVLFGRPTPSAARTTAQASHTNNCEAPTAYQPVEKPVRVSKTANKGQSRNGDKLRSCEFKPALREPTANERPHEKGYRPSSDVDPDSVSCDSDYSEGKTHCPLFEKGLRLSGDFERFGRSARIPLAAAMETC
jgi:hypothetical protein